MTRLLSWFSVLVGSTMLVPVTHAQRIADSTAFEAIGPRLVMDTTTGVRRATVACSAKRLCPAGWDLALVEVTTPAAIAAGHRTPVRVRVTNRGRLPAPEAPIVLQSGNVTEQRMLPALASGDTADVLIPLRFARDGGELVVRATIDPERLAGDKYTANNARESEPFVLEVLPTLVLTDVEPLTPRVQHGSSARIRVRVENRSRAWTTAGIVLRINPDGDGNVVSRAESDLALPVLPPQSATVLTIETGRLRLAAPSPDSTLIYMLSPIEASGMMLDGSVSVNLRGSRGR